MRSYRTDGSCREGNATVPEISSDGAVVSSEDRFEVASADARWLPVSVRVPYATAAQLGPGAHPLRFRIERPGDGDDAAAVVVEKSTFVVPR